VDQIGVSEAVSYSGDGFLYVSCHRIGVVKAPGWQHLRYAASLLVGIAIIWFAAASVGGFKGEVGTVRTIGYWLATALGMAIGLASIKFLPDLERKKRRWEPFVMIGFFWIAALIITPVLASARHAATKSSCLSNAKETAVALLVYGADFDERLPIASNWQTATERYRRGDAVNLKCPEGKTDYSYAMNQAASARKLEGFMDPEKTVLIFECDAYEANPSGGKEWFVPRHGGLGVVAMVDGRAKLANRDDVEMEWRK
jgi:hypothetical protein